MMREAMIQAGIIDHQDPIYRLELISEPEAAAAYCENRYNSWNLTDGNTFMIVDAGGGTVDLIT
jgi:molecular chaperone DnaK (HSP70)